MQIDESKFGKGKSHRGHHVEGQWIFGGIEQDSRKCFLVAVERRDEETLLPIIQKWTITLRDLVHFARSRSLPYNNSN